MASPADRAERAHRAPTFRRARGDAVEAAARTMLLAAGLRDIARNAACRAGEIDLVMRDGACVVFVEVRYRRDARFGGGAASVDAHKQSKLVRAAEVFLRRNPALASLPCRFDVVEAEGAAAAPTLHWIRNAFDARG